MRIQRQWLAWIVVFSLIGCQPVAPVSAPAQAAADHLLRKMNERLGLMERVAAYKLANAKPIADPEREAALLADVEEKAAAHQLPEKYAGAFFIAQIDAAKVLQENLLGRWKRENVQPKEAVDLAELRKRIDALNEELLAALVEYRKYPNDREWVRRKAMELLSGDGVNDHVRNVAIEPLLSKED